MPSNLDTVNFLAGDADLLERMADVPAWPPFADPVVRFLDDVSRRLMGNALAKAYSDVVTFAFWCRRASLAGLRKPYGEMPHRLGRGVVFHVAPANVPVNFAYSLAAGLLAGNANVVRVPSKDFPQVDLICAAIRDALAAAPELGARIVLLKYGHEKTVTDRLSARCDARIVWGGDDTIRTIRASPLPPRAVEIAFADRYSFAVIDADAYLKLAPAKVAQDFYNDTYLTDQNACTAPQLIAWRGAALAEAKARFWEALHRVVARRYVLPPVQAVGKWTAACRLAEALEGRLVPAADNLITRLQVPRLDARLMDYKHPSGFFIEYDLREMEEILPLCTLRCQTIAYLGLEPQEIAAGLFRHAPRGVDRLVPVGKTMDFALTWDGHDLIRTLTRVIGYA